MNPGSTNEMNDTKHFTGAPASMELVSDKAKTEATVVSEGREQQPNARPASSTAETNRSSSDTNAPMNPRPLPVNFAKLETARLWDYCRFYGIGVNDGLSRDQLLDAVNLHFVSQPVLKEEEVLSKFAIAVVADQRRKRISRR
ncbi:PREDICTED: uncharacterized protein LOC104806417 isoform X2 [Tarenaya hassleriana]|uniref:uncharacterized protein LOC104806417 isoform X2 n=1 Tax=Tarenaya hassleriana TaxID=28532 RepID=UPI00053C8F93|nr:PREDICTED: uncharacterized protein LOC104806417 isoform X2 [Tarenaya hassleriana]